MGRVKCKYDELSVEQYNEVEKTCKLCGKRYFKAWTKSGYSDFCSKECSRRFSTTLKREEINEKVSKALHGRLVGCNKNKSKNKIPKFCLICGKPIPLDSKKKKYCSKECHSVFLSEHAKLLNKEGKLYGGYRKGCSRGRSGFYKGIWCDSTYELVYLIYCLDNKVEIKRCRDVFTYEIDGKIKKYHPDFIVNGNIVEIKNYWRKEVDFKCDAVRRTGKEITVLYTSDLEPYMSYVDKKYGLTHRGKSNKYYVLYDKTEHC